MSIKDNPLSERVDTAYGTVTDLSEHDDIDNRFVQIGKFLLSSFIGGIKAIGMTLLLMVGGMVVLGIFLGIPSVAFQAIADGQYIFGSMMAILSLIIYGAGFNEMR